MRVDGFGLGVCLHSLITYIRHKRSAKSYTLDPKLQALDPKSFFEKLPSHGVQIPMLTRELGFRV